MDAVLSLLRAPDTEVLSRLSAAVGVAVPHSCAAALIAGRVRMTCVGSGSEVPTPTAPELAALADRVSPGTPWYGSVCLGGLVWQVLAVTPTEPAAAGCVLVLADIPGESADDVSAHGVVQGLWDVAVTRWKTLVSLGPVDPLLYLATIRTTASEHAKELLALKDAHAATLTAVLAALRSRRLADAPSREVAISIASGALIDLRSGPIADEITVGEAFASLGERLRSLARHSGFQLELAAPERADRLLPPEVAEAARAVVRGCVLAMLEHTGLRRIRVDWELQEQHLRVSVRDDGDGALFPQALAEYRLRERLAALGGDFAMEAVPGWGTSVTARFPLVLPSAIGPHTLEGLSRRELDVLAELARGLGNREIAERLHITEHTVKFHVANILSKLGVRSRGEAAAAVRARPSTP